MQLLVLLMIVAACSFDYLRTIDWLPGFAPYVLEVISICALLCVIVAGVRTRFRYVRAGYWLLFGAFSFVIACGIVSNGVAAGPLFTGMRTYLRNCPLFLLPAVVEFSQKQVKTQLMLVLAVSLFQLPLTLYQRLSKFTDTYTSGDLTVGTIGDSGILSVFLVCVVSVLVGFVLRKRMGLLTFLCLFLLILIPTTINETKATIFMLPLALVTVFVVAAPKGSRLLYTASAIGLVAIFGSLFVPVYDYFVKPRWGYGIIEFLTMEDRVQGYLEKKNAGVGMATKAGKIDGIVIPLRELSKDPAQLAFGMGIGNATKSSLGQQFTGRYYELFDPFMSSSTTRFLTEIGVLGLVLTLVFFVMVFNDARAVANIDDTLLGALAVGWPGVIVTLGLIFSYTDPAAFGSLTYLYWFLSGTLAAQRVRLALDGDISAAAQSQVVAR